MSVVIAKTVDGDEPVQLDIERLAYTRMFVQASSGGGKTNAVRDILEETHGRVQQIVLDWEGEYSNMREKYDYILAGKDGDIPADPRSAEILARRILELGTSLIVDLYALPLAKRLEYVQLFASALINSPKELYTHPILVVIDEIQHYIPQKQKKGATELANAVIDLITQGRKRGIGVIGVSQRISKVDKDGVAEFLNKAIGLCGLDDDRKRAGEELGFTEREQIRGLGSLEQGTFYVFGPAIAKHVQLAKFPLAKTDPPPLGHGPMKVPPPSDQVRKQLAKLTDLPAEAERELKSKEDMLNEIRHLRSELRIMKHGAPKPKIDEKTLQRTSDQAFKTGYAKAWREATGKYSEAVSKLQRSLSMATGKLNRISELVGGKIELPNIKIDLRPLEPTSPRILDVADATLPTRPVEVRTPIQTAVIQEGDVKYGPCEQMILKFLSLDSNLDRSFDKHQVGALTGYSVTSGGFKAALALLQRQGLIKRQGDVIQINVDRVDQAREISAGISLGSLQDWIANLKGADRKIYQFLYQNAETRFPRGQLAEDTGYSVTSGGFKASISHLKTLGLATEDGEGVRFNQAITEFL